MVLCIVEGNMQARKRCGLEEAVGCTSFCHERGDSGGTPTFMCPLTCICASVFPQTWQRTDRNNSNDSSSRSDGRRVDVERGRLSHESPNCVIRDIRVEAQVKKVRSCTNDFLNCADEFSFGCWRTSIVVVCRGLQCS
jgi:hypothetical protein